MPAERSAGFTLIEVMVALAVFSLAALALIRLEGSTARGAQTLDRSLLANLVARNIAIEAATAADAPPPGTERGSSVNAGRTFNWSRAVNRLGDRDVVRIDVVVSDLRGNQVGRATLVRPPRPQAFVQ